MPINIRNLDQYGLFNLFWNKHNDPDLSGGGLNEISQAGAQKLFDYATKHELDGTESAARQRKITPEEKEVIKALLEHPHYGRFFEQDGKVKLMELFGLRAEDVHSPEELRPKDAGELALPGRQSNKSAAQLAGTNLTQLPKAFEAEYKARKAEFEGGNGTPEEKSLKTLALLRDYTTALWSKGETGGTEAAGQALLDAFEKTRNGALTGSKNYNGAPWSAAQSLVLGLDPNSFPTDFPKAGGEGKTTYLSMDGEMADAMSHVDKYLAKVGKPAVAKEFELNSPLGFMIGEPSGHNKRGSLDESQPFSSSGLNWGIVIFPGDAEIKKLPPKEGFEFKIDCLDGLGNFLRCDPKYGESIKVVDEHGKDVKVEKVIHKEGGKAVSWSAKFKDARGNEIAADKVMGVIVDRDGRVKGDSKAEGSVDMWWWGFCDRNTAQKLYKSKYGIPELDTAGAIKVKAGNGTIEIPKAEAQKLIDCDIPDIVTGETMCGFRFNDEPQTISLKNGRTIVGRTAGDILENAPGVQRLGEDQLAVFNDAKRPMFGTIDIDTGDNNIETINTKNIKSITKDANGKVTVKVTEGWQDTIEGKLKTEVSFAGAKRVGNKQVLEQGETFPIRGELKIQTNAGEQKVQVKDVNQVVGETSKDLRISQFATWVGQNGGMYATDSSEKEVVSNGMRWANKIDMQIQQGDARPDWAPEAAEALHGILGGVERQAGDQIVWMRGMYAYQAGQAADSTSFGGWVQLSKSGRILNEGFTDGQPDFGWSALGKLNWSATSSFNPNMDPDLRIGILVNGVKALKADGPKTEELATQLNLPANWKTYRS